MKFGWFKILLNISSFPSPDADFPLPVPHGQELPAGRPDRLGEDDRGGDRHVQGVPGRARGEGGLHRADEGARPREDRRLEAALREAAREKGAIA